MLRFLQVNKDKPLSILTAGAALTRGGVVYTDVDDSQLKVLSSGTGDFFVDVSKNYNGTNSYINPTEGSFETIASGAKCIRVPTEVGERYATSQLTLGTLDKADPVTVSSGGFIKAAGVASYAWIFDGEYEDSTGIDLYIVEKVPTSTAPATKTVTYNANTGTGTLADAKSPYYVGKTVVVLGNGFTAPVGKIFSKWNTEANGSGTDYDPADEITVASANIVLYAQWVDNPNTFMLTYNANTGTGSMTDTDSPYGDGDTAVVMASTFTPPDGKIFSEWNTTAAGDGTAYDPAEEIAIEADMVLYATWVDAFTVTYDANTGTGTMADPDSPYATGSTVVALANAFTPPTDKTFVSWNTAANGTGTTYAPAAEITITGNVVLYAIWSA